MTKLLIEESVVRQALEALEGGVSAMRGLYGGWRCTTALKKSDQAITALKQAIEQQEKVEPSLAKYNRYMDGEDEPNPVERLRFFCSIAIKDKQDWIDIEPFFDAITNPAPAEPEET